jgi:hypothetical protein
MVFLILPPCEKNSWLAYSNKSCFASLILISLTYHLRYRRAEVLLEHADVVIYDALVSPEILAIINPYAEKIDAGKRRGRHSLLQQETTQLLIEKAQNNAVVVRLKGGDPFIFFLIKNLGSLS